MSAAKQSAILLDGLRPFGNRIVFQSGPLFRYESLHSLDRARLMLLRGVGIPEHHLDLGMAQKCRQSHQIDTGFGGSGCPSMA
jgi:hypothetical protein